MNVSLAESLNENGWKLEVDGVTWSKNGIAYDIVKDLISGCKNGMSLCLKSETEGNGMRLRMAEKIARLGSF